jgi:hypothetical protein
MKFRYIPGFRMERFLFGLVFPADKSTDNRPFFIQDLQLDILGDFFFKIVVNIGSRRFVIRLCGRAPPGPVVHPKGVSRTEKDIRGLSCLFIPLVKRSEVIQDPERPSHG